MWGLSRAAYLLSLLTSQLRARSSFSRKGRATSSSLEPPLNGIDPYLTRFRFQAVDVALTTSVLDQSSSLGRILELNALPKASNAFRMTLEFSKNRSRVLSTRGSLCG